MPGGKREGAGRPYGSGRYGEPTVTIRVPVSALPAVHHLLDKWAEAVAKTVKKQPATACHDVLRTRPKRP